MFLSETFFSLLIISRPNRLFVLQKGIETGWQRSESARENCVYHKSHFPHARARAFLFTPMSAKQSSA